MTKNIPKEVLKLKEGWHGDTTYFSANHFPMFTIQLLYISMIKRDQNKKEEQKH